MSESTYTKIYVNPGPKGDKGDTGPQGTPGVNAEVGVGTVETVGPNDPAQVIATGTPENLVLNFKLPKGASGSAGSALIFQSPLEYDVNTETVSLDEILDGGNF